MRPTGYAARLLLRACRCARRSSSAALCPSSLARSASMRVSRMPAVGEVAAFGERAGAPAEAAGSTRTLPALTVEMDGDMGGGEADGLPSSEGEDSLPSAGASPGGPSPTAKRGGEAAKRMRVGEGLPRTSSAPGFASSGGEACGGEAAAVSTCTSTSSASASCPASSSSASTSSAGSSFATRGDELGVAPLSEGKRSP
ncbi:hypothetical protein T492DRAFT_965466 [Pavlovales sp. CCMP2436]|nr:hypothetical protein T492DRAFT_965466 [Pavlovales sp. CCMP2436]